MSLILRDASLDLQKAVRDALKGRLNGNGGEDVQIYDSVPENTTFPYITVGNQQTVIDFSSKTSSGQEITFTVEIWSRYNGNAEAAKLASETTQLLTEKQYLLEGGWGVVMVVRESSGGMKDPDGETTHWVLKFRFKVSDLATVQGGNRT